jgi:hypothetical protein
MKDPRSFEELVEDLPALALEVMDGADPASGFMFPPRLVLMCPAAAAPVGDATRGTP